MKRSTVGLNCIALDVVKPIGVERFCRNVVSELELTNVDLTIYTRHSVDQLSKLSTRSFWIVIPLFAIKPFRRSFHHLAYSGGNVFSALFDLPP